jgi:hypothetical protein
MSDKIDLSAQPTYTTKDVGEHGWMPLNPPVETVAARDFTLSKPWDNDAPEVSVKAGEKVVITSIPGGDQGHGYAEGIANGGEGVIDSGDVVGFDAIWDLHPWNLRCPAGHPAFFENVSEGDVEVYKCVGDCKTRFAAPDAPRSKGLVPFCFTCENRPFGSTTCPDCTPKHKVTTFYVHPEPTYKRPEPTSDEDIPF